MKKLSVLDHLSLIHPDPFSKICFVVLGGQKREGSCRYPDFPGVPSQNWPRQIPRTFWLERKDALKYLGSLKQVNKRYGLDVYYSMANYGDKFELRKNGSKKILRTEENVVGIQALYADYDYETEASAFFKVGKPWKGIPTPNIVVSTSLGRSQAIWLTEKNIDLVKAKDLLTRLCVMTGGDPAVKDLSRVMRLPGYQNMKREGWPVESILQHERRLSEVDLVRLDEQILPCEPGLPEPKALLRNEEEKANLLHSFTDSGEKIGQVADIHAQERWEKTYTNSGDKGKADWAVTHYFRSLGIAPLEAYRWLVCHRGEHNREYLYLTVKNAYLIKEQDRCSNIDLERS